MTEDSVLKLIDEIEYLETVNTKAFLYGSMKTATLSNRKWLELAQLLKAQQEGDDILFFPEELTL